MAKPATTIVAPFTWRRCPSGYAIDPMPGAAFEWIHPRAPEAEPTAPAADLYLDFAALAQHVAAPRNAAAQEAIQNFADSNGLLFGIEPEDVMRWLWEALKIATAVDVWRGLRERDDAMLRRCFSWRGAKCIYDSHPDLEIGPGWAAAIGLQATAERDPAVPRIVMSIASAGQFQPPDVRGPARYFLQAAVKANLNQVAGGLFPVRGGLYDLRFTPTTLLGFMWLSFASAIARQTIYRPCAACGRLMLISPEGRGARQSRLTCSNGCRMQAYLKRVAEARRLAKRRLPVAEIVARVGAKNQKSVKRWIAGSNDDGKAKCR